MFGWKMALAALPLSFMVSGLVGVLLLATWKKGRKAVVPFGPFLAVGTAATLYAGPTIYNWYVSITYRFFGM